MEKSTAKRVTATLLDSAIAKAAASGKRDDMTDSEVPGLTIRIGTGGRDTVSYSLSYRTKDGTKTRYPLNTDRNTTLADAREQALKLRSLIKSGTDPHERDREAEKAKADAKLAEERELTFAQLADKWLSEYAAEFRKPATVQID